MYGREGVELDHSSSEYKLCIEINLQPSIQVRKTQIPLSGLLNII